MAEYHDCPFDRLHSSVNPIIRTRESEKTYKQKLVIAAEYQLVELRNHCIMRLDTKEAISAAMPTDVRDMDPTAAKPLLQKLICLK
ncbi:hypothetical protein CAEBREN_01928 [Caenorhabditis brenneri]|uniref:Uncharacterized protein n=1 Tax=Caenorhabditis brenneri TaxID=135651 RepID=G0P3B1_CAEBE|nr:hypothetical protein CAEBREN_01928 [Caenorhabditis brenneri]